MASELHVELVAVEQKVWTGEAETVVARTTEGNSASCPVTRPCSASSPSPER